MVNVSNESPNVHIKPAAFALAAIENNVIAACFNVLLSGDLVVI